MLDCSLSGIAAYNVLSNTCTPHPYIPISPSFLYQSDYFFDVCTSFFYVFSIFHCLSHYFSCLTYPLSTPSTCYTPSLDPYPSLYSRIILTYVLITYIYKLFIELAWARNFLSAQLGLWRTSQLALPTVILPTRLG